MKSKILSLLLGLFSCISIASYGKSKNLYDFKVQDIDGKEFDFSSLKGKKVMIVNVASKCGFTPQYKDLEALYREYKDKNFVIVAFPSNDFKNQEPGTNAEIKQFCTLNYGVSFPIMSKIDVVGPNRAAIYKWLTQKSENGKFDAEVEWNFHKFLIDEKGKVVQSVPTKENPQSERIVKWISGK